MARALGDILTELNTVYDPQKALVKEQMQTIDPSQSAEMQGLQSAQQDAFQAITEAANRRGMFYSGAPIAEQQKYTGATYLPAVANLRAKYAQQKFNLQDTLNKIQAEQQLKAQGIYQEELNRDLQRQLADEAAARARASGGGGGGGGLGGFDFGGGGGGGGAPPAADPYAGIDQQRASNAIESLLRTNDKNIIFNTIKAIKDSASRGSLYDKFKLDLLDKYRTNSQFGNLLFQVSKMKPPAPAPSNQKGFTVGPGFRSYYNGQPVKQIIRGK